MVEKRELTCCKTRYFGQQRLQIVQDFHILGLNGLFLFSTPLRVIRQVMSSSIYLALMVIDWEVVMRKFLSPTDLTGPQTLCVYKFLEVVVVNKYKNIILEAL